MCRLLVVERTAWTENNAGRRFVSCVKGRNGCNFFRWTDPPVCARGRAVICGLLRRIERNEEELEKLMLLQEEKSNCRVQKFRCLNVKMFVFIVVVIWFVWTRF
ncbi:hypothetical protein DCAR_0311170 [Daucus carota subsp. sativus]|uniref:GRF-type domain-containing protein n=1 Tax=Daucus carota subsp. sativus TaxID=79200 RepID=A0A162AHW2_DAUCS|nr:hypothetical protein DCAR_0311170 [Daucus carota subsp. sativus]